MNISIMRYYNKSPWDDIENSDNIFTKVRQRNRSKLNFDEFRFDFSPRFILFGLVAILFIWLASGIYEVKEGEQAIITRFGKFVRSGYAGLNYRLPYPIESEIIEKVNTSRRIEIGYRSAASSMRNASEYGKIVASESAILTGDENIIVLNYDVMWHIKDLTQYIFNIMNPEEAVKTAAESAVREVIGNTPLTSVLASQKQEITVKIEELTQKILDQYHAGINIEKVQLLKAEPPTEVIDAYRDVQAAKADKQDTINKAEAYNNDILPKARGEAAKIIQEAEAYKQEIISKAIGDSARFISVYNQYKNNKELTRNRLYLDTMQKILQDSNTVIMGNAGVLPHMALDNIKK